MERDGGEQLIAAHTQNIPYLSTITTQHKTNENNGAQAHNAHIDDE